MNILDMMEETEVKVGISNYAIRIMGESGKGKTPLYSYFARAIQKEVGSDKPVCGLIPLEDRYDHIKGLVVIKPTIKDKAGNIVKQNGKPVLKKTIETWSDFVEIVDALVEQKLNDPNFQIQRVCIDTTTKLEMIAQKQVVALDFEETKVLKDFNKCFGAFGRNYAKVVEIVTEQLKRLTGIGYKVDTTVQMRNKSQVSPITGEEYHVKSSDCSESYDGKAFLQNADISFVIAEPIQLKQTGVDSKGKAIKQAQIANKVLILDSNGEYKGCKSPFPNPPKQIPADDFEQTVNEYLKLFKARMSGDISPSTYTEKVKLEDMQNTNIANVNMQIVKTAEEQTTKEKEINEFLEVYEQTLKVIDVEAGKQWGAYFNSLQLQKTTYQKYTNYLILKNRRK